MITIVLGGFVNAEIRHKMTYLSHKSERLLDYKTSNML